MNGWTALTPEEMALLTQHGDELLRSLQEGIERVLGDALRASAGSMTGLAILYVNATSADATDADREAFDRAMDEVQK